ncbi:MAG TPA: hypothetical protein VEH84_12285 [Alphaproteobacteria bacterium]|nr:hypothetical protein [Alphaproteobacteria bacterium]
MAEIIDLTQTRMRRALAAAEAAGATAEARQQAALDLFAAELARAPDGLGRFRGRLSEINANAERLRAFCAACLEADELADLDTLLRQRDAQLRRRFAALASQPAEG